MTPHRNRIQPMSYDDEAFWHRDDPDWNPKRGTIRRWLLRLAIGVALWEVFKLVAAALPA